MKTIVLMLALATLPIAGRAETESPQIQRATQMQNLIMAAQDLPKIEELLKGGFDVEQPIGCGLFDSLDGAVAVANPSLVELLLRYGAKPKESTFVNAAFIPSHEAALKIVRAFLAAGCDVNSKEHDASNPLMSWTALHQAVWRENGGLVDLLLSRKDILLDEINGDDQTALMIAVAKGNPALVKKLVAAGADPGLKNAAGLTAADVSRKVIENQRELQAVLAKPNAR